MADINRVAQDETVLGIDYGQTNTGVAIGRNGLVSPLKVIPSKNSMVAIREIVRLAIENKALKIVVGVPLTPEGKETRMSLEVRKFIKLLRGISKKEVIAQNENSSTLHALEEANSTAWSRKSKKKSDHLSAAFILKNFLDGAS